MSPSSLSVLCYALNRATAFFPSPALFTFQQAPVSGDLSLQLHLRIQQLSVALALAGQSHPHLLQLGLQPGDHLGEVLQAAGVQLLRVLQRGLQALLLNSESHSTINATKRVENCRQIVASVIDNG